MSDTCSAVHARSYPFPWRYFYGSGQASAPSSLEQRNGLPVESKCVGELAYAELRCCRAFIASHHWRDRKVPGGLAGAVGGVELACAQCAVLFPRTWRQCRKLQARYRGPNYLNGKAPPQPATCGI
jgi:hypothetical protein